MRLRETILIFSALCAMLAVNLPQLAFAVNPDEVLQDVTLEKRARDLSSIIRCMKCQNQSIDDSDADLAKDLRVLVRDRLTKGDTDQEVLDYLVDRYGEFVLLKPSFSVANSLLWLAPLLTLLFGVFFAWRVMSTRQPATTSSTAIAALSKSERDTLSKILDDQE